VLFNLDDPITLFLFPTFPPALSFTFVILHRASVSEATVFVRSLLSFKSLQNVFRQNSRSFRHVGAGKCLGFKPKIPLRRGNLLWWKCCRRSLFIQYIHNSIFSIRYSPLGYQLGYCSTMWCLRQCHWSIRKLNYCHGTLEQSHLKSFACLTLSRL
jgi:hypothetical protein